MIADQNWESRVARETKGQSARRQLRRLVAERQALLVPGAANALGARLIEDAGFQALYITGAGLANSHLGMPDIGLLTVSELCEATARISDVCSLPLLVDIDTGFGNAVNTYRTMRLVERAGASAVQIEDQIFPKKCGHFAGKGVVPLPEMLGKLKAALDARQDPDLQVIARTDAISVDGVEAALDRAHAFIETGADIVFVEAPTSRGDIERIAALPAPQVMNVVIGGKTPMMSVDELRELGFAIVLYANATLQATILAVQDVLKHLKHSGSLRGYESKLAGFEERQRVVGKTFFDELEQRYAGD